MKKLLSILTLLLCVCSGAWAQDDPTLTVEFLSSTTSDYIKAYPTEGITLSGDGSLSSGNGNYSYRGLSGKSEAVNSKYLGIDTNKDYITKVRISVTPNSTGSATGAVLIGWSAASPSLTNVAFNDFKEGIQTASAEKSAAEDLTFTLDYSDNIKSIRLYRNIKKNIFSKDGGTTYIGAGSDYGTGNTPRIWKVEIWTQSADNRTEVGAAFSATSTSIAVNNTQATTLTLTNPNTDAEITGSDLAKYAISYTSSAPAVATVNASGVVTGLNAGSATIIATITDADANDKATFKGTTKTIDFTVTDPNAESGTITWAFDDNTTTKAAVIADDISSYISSPTITMGSSVEFEANTDHCYVDSEGEDDVIVSRVKPSEATNNNITFTFTPIGGKAFTPTSVSFVACKQGTDNAVTLDAKWMSEDEDDITLESAHALKRASSSGTYATPGGERLEYDLSAKGAATTTGTCGLKITLNTATRSYGIGEIIITGVVGDETETVTVSTAGYATFASDKTLDFTNTSIKAYKASVSGSSLTFNKVNIVPAGEGVLLYANGGATQSVPVTANAADDFTGNKLVRGTGAAVASDNGDGSHNYILSNNGGVVNFYLAAGKTVGTDKAFLSQISASTAKISLPGDDDETTAINELSTKHVENGKFYNLQGMEVKNPTKGIYIVNGKKVIIK